MEGRESDIRVPLIACLFCVLLITGGTFLVLHVFVPHVSGPWFPVVALVLIASPWIFWFVTFIYMCVKRCCGLSSRSDRQISRRSSRNEMSPAGKQDNFMEGTQADEISIANSRESEMPLT